ncbi:pyrroline-5-carboxylate reductase [Salipaludibacillus aurantiacus]|uniref:Pyrroline-5-carboxylate reductase n=1 Tax=Salipaludibacillus aurantiacus TaxID=1601833 RepID=A0A1H9PH29_9BACI|nr:pyrroline-5-carboxylate reductase [Salipaludibacillus aurantiacus]SER47467.1 pyrroline-5-carboxylate reductase [Salipaludibacillus aurantiacus]
MVNISILGGGSMAEALTAGWVRSGKVPSGNILASNRSNDLRLKELEETYGIKTSRSPEKIYDHGDIFILACKPKDWQKALAPFKNFLNPDTPLVSVMAGVTINSMEDFFPETQVPVMRTIPNTSAVVNASMTPYAAGKWVTADQKTSINHLFQLVGDTAEVPEQSMDAMTALTGTGPAYIYYLMESMELAAEEIGIDKKLARHLVSQTLLGAGLRVQENDLSPSILYQQIMSPGGTTEAGFKVLKEQGMQDIMINCIHRAFERSKELGGSETNALAFNKNHL